MRIVLLTCLAIATSLLSKAQEIDSAYIGIADTVTVVADTALQTDVIEPLIAEPAPDLRIPGGGFTIYDYPYSRDFSIPNWKRMWINTGVLTGAGVLTMVILQSLPADATAWNKREDAKTPMFTRWWRNVRKGPVWDGDNPVFNYMLHPYAGAAYYMGARSQGFSMWGSFVYCFCISTFFWEYGFEAFNEVPSVQDLIITPVVGSLLGEGFYMAKRKIVENDYRVLGSRVLGIACAWLCDPINETIGAFRGDQHHQLERNRLRRGEGLSGNSWIAPSPRGLQGGLSLVYNF